ncbi:MAG: hypothetical protein SGPRY_009064 [Prymnesium sp.]
MDGLVLTNPLGAAAGRHKVAISYVVLLNLSTKHRTSPHCILPAHMCYEKEFSRYLPVDIVCGPERESIDGTSFGAEMRRWASGDTKISVPRHAAWYCPGVVQRAPVSGRHYVPIIDGLMLVSADTPAAAALFGTKRSVGPSTVAICRLCYCKQVERNEKQAHRQLKSFLPWRRCSTPAGNTVYECSDQDLLSNIHKARNSGAKQVYELRTPHSVLRDMQVADQMRTQRERDYHSQQIVGQFNNRVATFGYCCRGARPRSYSLPDNACAVKIEDCLVGNLWTAHNTMLLVCFSIELLRIFVPDGEEDDPVWLCWVAHYNNFRNTLHTTSTRLSQKIAFNFYLEIYKDYQKMSTVVRAKKQYHIIQITSVTFRVEDFVRVHPLGASIDVTTTHKQLEASVLVCKITSMIQLGKDVYIRVISLGSLGSSLQVEEDGITLYREDDEQLVKFLSW